MTYVHISHISDLSRNGRGFALLLNYICDHNGRRVAIFYFSKTGTNIFCIILNENIVPWSAIINKLFFRITKEQLWEQENNQHIRYSLVILSIHAQENNSKIDFVSQSNN